MAAVAQHLGEQAELATGAAHLAGQPDRTERGLRVGDGDQFVAGRVQRVGGGFEGPGPVG
ncbi:hypothetical protein GA0115256_11481, partial [Streptomyces sp. DconLS]